VNPYLSLPLADMGWSTLAFFFFIFGGGGLVLEAIKNTNRTRIKMAELKATQSDAATQRELAAVREEMAALREQVASLRDTTTQYDISFDAALQHIERRVHHVEQQQQQPQHQRIGV
jgi:hypothetical protein